jgi:hypothetical protein
MTPEHERTDVAETKLRELAGLLFCGIPKEQVDVNADPFDIANRVIARAEHLHQQIDALATVLLKEFGGPTQDEGACEMAIRVLREQKADARRWRAVRPEKIVSARQLIKNAGLEAWLAAALATIDELRAERDAAQAHAARWRVVVAEAGVELEDERISYVAVQIDRDDWLAARTEAPDAPS